MRGPSDAGIAGDAAITEAAREIATIDRKSSMDRTLSIGALVLNRFFAGSVALWRERRNRKNNSVRRLAQCPECPLSRSSLNRSIAIYALTLACPRALELDGIDASHLGAVLSVPAAEQERWLRRAAEARWSVRQLKDAIQGERRGLGRRRGRPKATDWSRDCGMTTGVTVCPPNW